MSNSTKKMANATSHTQNYVEKTHKGSYLTTDEQITGTPFVLRWRDGKGWFLTIGGTRLTEPTETKEETLNLLTEEMYSLIAGMIVHVVELFKKDDIVTKHKNEL